MLDKWVCLRCKDIKGYCGPYVMTIHGDKFEMPCWESREQITEKSEVPKECPYVLEQVVSVGEK